MITLIIYLIVFWYGLVTTSSYALAGQTVLFFAWYWEIFWTSIVALASIIVGTVAGTSFGKTVDESKGAGVIGGLLGLLLAVLVVLPLLAMSLYGIYLMYHALIPFHALNFTIGAIMWLIVFLLGRLSSGNKKEK